MTKIPEKLKALLKNKKHLVPAAALCMTAVVLTGCFFAYAAAYQRIFPNVRVEDLDVGGMKENDAIKEINAAFYNIISERRMDFECCGNKKTVALEELGAELDEKKTAEAAFNVGRQGGVLKKTARLLLSAFKKTELPLEISIDEAKLEALISELAAGNEVEPEKAGYTLEGNQLTVKKGHGGKRVDRQKAIAAVKAAVADTKASKLVFEIEEIAAEKVDVDKFYEELSAPAKDAEYKYEDGKVSVIDEKPRIIVDKEKLKQALRSETDGYTLTVETEMPEVSGQKLRDMLFRDTLGTYSSAFYTSTAERASNVTLTAQRINGYILMPGDVFSYDKTIGRRTAANGYKTAGVYVGNKVESGIGGGICQTSSTLYSAALYANLEIVSRTSHSLPVSYVPAGQDATIAEGYIDLKLKNNTEYPVKIVAAVNDRKITCSILGVKIPGQTVELVHSTVSTSEPKLERTVSEAVPKGYKYVTNKGASGYTVASNRIVKINGETVKNEKLTRSIYRAAPIEEKVNPADKDTPSEKLKPYTPGMKIPEEDPKTPNASDTEDDGQTKTDALPEDEAEADENAETETKTEAANNVPTPEEGGM